MTQLDGMSHSGFDVGDLDACERFYVDVLGGKVKWKRDLSGRAGGYRTKSMKIYVGDLGLSIGERPKDKPAEEVPFAVHWAYRADHEHVLEYVEHIKSFGVEVDGPVGHGNEPQNVSWFFRDPDGQKLELEAHYPTAEEALTVVEQGQAERKPDMEIYRGTDSVEKIRQRAGLSS